MLPRAKYFLWMVYAAAAVQLVVSLLPDKTWSDFALFVVVAAIIIALAWAAVRKQAKYAVWLLSIFFAFDIASTVGELWGEGAFWLQQALAPEHHVTGLQMILDVVTNLLEGAALYFYFFGGAVDGSRPHRA